MAANARRAAMAMVTATMIGTSHGPGDHGEAHGPQRGEHALDDHGVPSKQALEAQRRSAVVPRRVEVQCGGHLATCARHQATVAAAPSASGVACRPKVCSVSVESVTNGSANWYQVSFRPPIVGLEQPSALSATFGTAVTFTVVPGRGSERRDDVALA